MYARRGRGGPSRSTPANVQCQKCLKRGHYSYECKASAQERPYVPRPSRTQQLLNPKLVPKLTSDTPNPLEKKKGVADEELAKMEAERARKRELEERDDELLESQAKRRRSVSSDSGSVSTISTGASRASASPRNDFDAERSRRRRSSREDLSDNRHPARDSYSRSPSPPRRNQRSLSRDSLSPAPRRREASYRSRSPNDDRSRSPRAHDETGCGRGDGYSDEEAPRTRRYREESRSRSPEARYGRGGYGRRGRGGQAFRRGPRDRSQGPPRPPADEQPRERSLSPFSRRLALTQSMNGGAR